MNKVLFLWLLCSSFLLAGENIEEMDPLPSFFEPLSWEIDNDQMSKSFLKKSMKVRHDRSYRFNSKTYTYSILNIDPINWKHIGDASVGISFTKKKYVNRIKVDLRERRSECDIYLVKDKPNYCRYHYSKNLVQIIQNIEKDISKEIPLTKKIIKNGEYIYKWDTKTYTIDAMLTQGIEEDIGLWFIEVTVRRKNKIHGTIDKPNFLKNQ